MSSDVPHYCCLQSDLDHVVLFQPETKTDSSCPAVDLSEDSDEGKRRVNMLTSPPESDTVTPLNITNRDQSRGGSASPEVERAVHHRARGPQQVRLYNLAAGAAFNLILM